ncbi:MAG: transporter related, partial [Paenibacillaceae bacterium]|nr:transporter related [Paenibacillaceae bacterium]
MTTILTAESIGKSYGIKPLFHQVNLHIETGDRLGLIGVNGSGKTTLLQVLAGAEQPDEGNVRLHDPMRIEYLP